MLVFSAIVPHPPVLIPAVGKDNAKKLKKTAKAFEQLKEALEESKPAPIIIISPHGDVNFDAFTINTNKEYIARFEKFGDFSTERKFLPDLEYINTLKSCNETKLPVQLVSNENLDHGASVPLFQLLPENSKVKIVPVITSLLSFNKQLEFGKMMKEAAFSLDKRYAIIASGDLSHKLSMKAPAGFSKTAKEFDKKLIQLLKKQNTEGVLNMDQALVKDAAECGLRSILILLGVVQNMNYDFEVLSYESPFGVGYLIGEFNFK